MKKICVLFFLLLSIAAMAAEYQSPISKNRENYFAAGNTEDQTKFQLSLKADLLYPFNTGMYFGYTQTTWWQVYDGADTMSANYQPEVFYRLDSKNNIFNNVDLKAIDFIQVSPFNHCSTGIEGEDHRSINIYYGQIQMSTDSFFSVGFNLKGFGYYSKNKNNKDIEKFKGYYENDVFIKLNTSTNNLSYGELHFKHGGTLSKGWFCIEAQSIILSSKIQPRLFIQYFYGYGENMVNYDTKERSVYAGLLF